jgi:succinylglutamate desuccinylase
MLKVLEHIPAGLLSAAPAELATLLGGPTLIHLAGRRTPALFTSVLLHGNEAVGLLAVQQLLTRYQERELPRALSIFIGNVAAARHGLRRLDAQPDYNRVWPGGIAGVSPESRMMSEIVENMRVRGVFASIDVHNNTGLNPHYGCVNRLDPSFLHLATLFSRTVVYFTEPPGVQSRAFADLCPAVTIECGKPGSPGSDTHAAEFLEAALHLSDFPQHPVAAHDIDLYHTVATVKVPDNIDFSFGPGPATLQFEPDLDHLNFRELAAGTRFARILPSALAPLHIPDACGGNRWQDFFSLADGDLVLRRPLMPSMLTLDQRIIRQDCLCYLMERLPLPAI